MKVHIIKLYIGAQPQVNFLPGIKIENEDEYGNADIYIDGLISIIFHDDGVKIKYRCAEDGEDYIKRVTVFLKKTDFYKIEIG